MLGESQAALQTCAEGLKLDAGDAELWFQPTAAPWRRGDALATL
jgi:hypothetical protein